MAGEREEISIERMREEDLDEIMEIEKASFPNPWTRWQFAQEVDRKPVRNRLLNWSTSSSHFLVAKSAGKVVGYGGFFLVKDEAHIGNLAVHPELRGRKIGERLLLAMLGQAKSCGARKVSLEVRAGNKPAQKLYQKLGFSRVATRPRYYVLTQEDAITMSIDLPECQKG